MAAKNIECQIAQGQMSRYLAGDNFSPDLAVELRAHIAECPECAATLEKRRAILQAMFDKSGPNAAANFENLIPADTKGKHEAQEDSDRPNIQNMLNILRNRAGEGHAAVSIESTSPTKRYWKPLAFGGSLLLVLFLMSQIMRDPTRLFGERAGGATTAAASSGSEPKSPNNAISKTAAPTSPRAGSADSDAKLAAPTKSAATSSAASENALPSPAGTSAHPDAAQTASSQAGAMSSAAKPQPKPHLAAMESTKTGIGIKPFVRRRLSARRAPAHRRISKTPRHNPIGIRIYDANGNLIHS